YLAKQEALDLIAACAKQKRPLLAIEVVRLTDSGPESSLYKTVWFKTQRGVYRQARDFVIKQMVGEWLWCEIKEPLS
ncbi:MAG: hypothetical protein JNM00_01385, partial [Flavobacteriales bacterium]|nr:hypothetical protein [Flavobacteriales bacterium]